MSRPALLPFLIAASLVVHPAPVVAEQTPLALEGESVRALAAHPAVSAILRLATGGRQRVAAERLRLPSVPLRIAEDRFVYGWACAPEGCGTDGIFLAFDAQREQLFLVLTEEGAANLTLPPRAGIWPEPLAEPLRAFDEGVATRMRFGAH